jgi:CRP-like cAMP-binding protein
MDLQQRILAEAYVRDFSKGQVIGLEGRVPGEMCAVLAGQVKLVRHTRPGDEALLYICEPGFWFGEYGLLTAQRTLVSAIAKTKVRLLVLPKRAFDLIVDEEPRFYRHFASRALVRAATYLKAFVHGSSLEPASRLRGQLALLCQLKLEEHGTAEPLDLPYSQSELASILGVSRQTTNALLQALAAHGVVELGFRRLRILRPGRLLP